MRESRDTPIKARKRKKGNPRRLLIPSDLIAAENLAHHANQLQGARIADTIVNAVGILARQQNSLFAQYGQMLRDVALRRADRIDNLLYASLLVTDHTQYLETQRV